MRRMTRSLATAAVAAALSLTALVGCGGESSSAPGNLSFDTSTGGFTFDAVEGGDTYTVGVSKVLNDATGQALESINGSATIDLGDGNSEYVWSEQTGSASGVADIDGDGTVDGTVIFREFSSSATTVGAVMTMDQLAPGHYILSAVPTATDELTAPETVYCEFTIAGTLAAPEGFTAKVNDEGVIEICAPSDYYLECLTATGLPTEMKFEVKDGDEVVDTITMDDFSYTNTVNGPNKMFTFNNQMVTGTAQLDASKAYTVTVTAVGDGDQIKDASAEAYMATDTAPVEMASVLDTTGSGSATGLTMTLSLGEDGSGKNVYELTASANDMVIYRESGTFEASEEAGTHNEKNTFPDGTKLTFSTSATDADAPVLDGVTLTVAEAESMGWGPNAGGFTYSVEGEATFNGETFEFGGSTGGGMGPMGPM